jgi:5-methyltetrahydrofolate--homocysteine methyltransferase
MKPSVASLYQAIELVQDIPPLIIGERANPNGSKKFRELLLADDFDGCLQIALEQENQGAHVIDLCVAYAGRDEMKDLLELLPRVSGSLKTGLMIDTTTPDCIEECLKIYPGRLIVNSINLEDGGDNLHRICRLAKKYGAAVVALTIDVDGMAMTADRKVEVAWKIYDLAVNEHGLRPQDILFDPLTFTIGSGDETLRDAAVQTLVGIRRIKGELPGVLTILGVSNVSFGLRPQARRVLNSIFLHEAVKVGLDAAIVDAGKIIPYARISEREREICLDLLFDRPVSGDGAPIMRLIEHFEEEQAAPVEEEMEKRDVLPEESLRQKLVAGDKDGLEDLLNILLIRHSGIEIINNLLVPGMRYVGELFGRGELLLPFVLQSAEVMNRCVTFLEPYLEKREEADQGTSVLLATVQGDVHDIGKNLVDIILSNNGYRVHNLGIKVPAERIIEKARELNVDIIGLSGLLVKSAIVMKESMPQYREAGLNVPILLGGAALTEKFVAESCVPGYEGTVVYCADAFAGLKAVQDFEEGRLESTVMDAASRVAPSKPGVRDPGIDRSIPVPQPPFTGARHVTDIDPDALFPYLNVEALIRGRWGYRRGKMSKEEYGDLIEGTVRPLLENLKLRGTEEGLLQPKVAYGYFPCSSEGNSLNVTAEGRAHRFDFPRQEFPPHLCIADYFKSSEEGGDIVGFFVVTIGDRIAKETESLFQSNAYHEYLIMHGFGVEITDALAEYWHEQMREELGISADKAEESIDYVTQKYQGSRYGFGYPSCPDLGAHRTVFALLKPEKIGITLTENMMMVPEQSTSAIVAHHPQAKYFAV